MLKKILALSVSVLMVMSVLFAIPASAAIVDLPENIGTDWVPKELTGNRYKSGSVYNPYAGPTYYYSSRNKEITIVHDGALGDGIAAPNQERGAYGAGLGVTSNEFWIGEETFIFMVNAKNNGGKPRINFGVWQASNPTLLTNEYPTVADGALVTNTDYKRYVFTVTVPKLAWNAASDVNFNLGLAETPAGETETTRSVKFDESSIYIGAEYANDLVVTAENTNVRRGTSVIIDADVLNQIGLTGKVNQSVSWYVTDATRTKKVSGITVAKRVDGKAILRVDSSVPLGEYYVVAVSDANENIVKGLKFEVVLDYEPGVLTGNVFTGFSQTYDTSYENDGTTLTLSTSGTLGDGIAATEKERGAYGASINVTSREFWQPGNTIIFTANVKAASGTPRVNFAVWQASYPALLPLENPRVADGTTITSTDWQKVSFTMTIPESEINDSGNIILGFGFAETPEGQTEGERSVIVDISSVYLASEYAYDMDVSANSTTLSHGKTVEVDADVLNQLGAKSKLSQEVNWKVMNSSRTETVSGFIITSGADGTASVSIDSSVPVGDYYIVAQCTSNEDIVKGIKITVSGTSTAVVTQSYDFVESNSLTAKQIVVTYDENGKMLTADIVNVN